MKDKLSESLNSYMKKHKNEPMGKEKSKAKALKKASMFYKRGEHRSLQT